MKKPMVYIGIVTYNSALVIESCLRSISKQTYPHIRIVIFDNNSKDKTLQIVSKQTQHITIIKNTHNSGFGSAHNAILKSLHLGSRDYYLPLNPDIELDPKYIEELQRGLTEMKADWGTGKLYKRAKKRRMVLYSVGHAMLKDGYAFNIAYNQPDNSQYNKNREVFGAPAAASLITALLITRVSYKDGLFDPYMFLYNEDTDLDWRARLHGFHCAYVHKAIAFHIGSHPTGIIALHALANRYRSVFKNAFTIDLCLYNIPRIVLHVCFRILSSFHEGMWLGKKILAGLPSAIALRTKPTVTKQYMHAWFVKNKKEHTDQPTTLITRMQQFAKQHHAHI